MPRYPKGAPDPDSNLSRDFIARRDELREEIKAKFNEMRQRTGMGVAKGAKQVGVSREAFRGYLKEDRSAIPSADVLLAACERWNLTIQYAGRDFRATPAKPPSDRRSEPVQLSLFDAIHELVDESVEVKIRRKEAGKATGRIELMLGISFKHGTCPTDKKGKRAAAATPHPPTLHEFLVNVRAEGDPAVLRRIVETQFERISGSIQRRTMQWFSPAPPKPEQRFASVVGDKYE